MQNNPMFAPGFAWKRSKSIVALVTLVAFTVTTLVWDPSAFAGTGVPAAGEVSVFSREVLRIPAELGQVTETLMGDPKAPAFIHIQSAHGNYSAEKNIEKLLKFIEKNSSVKLMLLEGASGKLCPEMFRVFPAHPEFNQKVTDKLAREGYLTGPERFLVEDGTRDVARVEGYGIEDLESYKKDREAFIRVMRANGSAEKYVASLRASIDQRYSMQLGKDLLNLVRQEEAFGSGTVSFEGWLAVLKAASRKHLALDLSDAFYQDRYPHLIRYYRLREIGSKIDRKAAMNELDLFIKELEKRKIAKETIELFEQVGAEGARPLAWGVPGSMKSAANRQAETRDAAHARGYSPTRRAFDLAFEELPKDFSMKPWPHLKLYAQHTIFMEELEAKGLRDEMTRLKDDIYGSLAKTEAEKAYVREARDLYLSRKLFSLELTRSEYEELVRSKARGARGNDKAREVAIEKLYDAAMDFYETAISRERYMFQNALKKMAATKQQHAVIVTGGFHTEGLKELAKEKNASYLQITPRINEVSKNDHEVYLRSIMGSRDVETSQMSALLGIVDRAQRVTVTGLTATQDWANDVRRLILGMITTEPVDLQPVLAREFSGSVFSDGIPQVVSLPAPADPSVVKVSSEMSPESAKQSRAELRQDQTATKESKLTPTQEKQFQEALRDLQPKWWDAVFVKSAVSRRILAAKILGELKDPRAVHGLVGAWARNSSEKVREAVVKAFGLINDRSIVPTLSLFRLQDESKLVRAAAVDALKEHEAIAELVLAVDDSNFDVRQKTIAALRYLNAFAELSKKLNSKYPDVRAAAVSALRELKSVPQIVRALNDEDSFVRATAIAALQELKALSELGKELSSKYMDVRFAAFEAVGDLRDASAVSVLIGALKDRTISDYAAQALEKIDDPRSASVLATYKEMRRKEKKEQEEREEAERIKRESEASGWRGVYRGGDRDYFYDRDEWEKRNNSFVPLPLLALAGDAQIERFVEEHSTAIMIIAFAGMIAFLFYALRLSNTPVSRKHTKLSREDLRNMRAYLRDEEPEICARAVETLVQYAKVGDLTAFSTLVGAFYDDAYHTRLVQTPVSHSTKVLIVIGMGEFDYPAASQLLNDALNSRNREIATKAAESLEKIKQRNISRSETRASFQEVDIERNPLTHKVIAIDGPSASGKGTVARMLATELGYLHIDLGTFNRAIAEKALREGVDLDDSKAVQKLLERTTLEARFVNAQTQLLRDGLPVTDSIRSAETGNAAAVISRHAGVLQWIFQQARSIGENHDVVMEGRNIGTDVFPDAQWKFYITADVEVRAARRLSDFRRAGDVNISLRQVQEDLQDRDRRDRTRSVAPFRKAVDAFEIDNTSRSADETVGIMKSLMADSSARPETRVFAGEVNKPGESTRALTKSLAIFTAAFTALSAHAAEEMPGGLGFRAEHPLAFAILLGAAGIICVIPIFFVAWRLMFPLSWFMWRAGSEEAGVRNYSKGQLVKIGHSAVPALINTLSTTSVDKQITVIEALGEIKDDRAVEPLLELLEHGKTSDVRGVSATALGQMRNPKVVPALVKALQDDDNVCSLAVDALGKMGEVKVLPAIIRESKNPARGVGAQDALVRALKSFKAIDALADLMSDPRDNICFCAATALSEIGDKTLLPLFISELQNKERSNSVYSVLISGIDRWKDPSVIPALLGRLDERLGEGNRRAVASILLYFTSGTPLAGLRRYFEWIKKTSENTYSILSNDEIAGIQAAYLRGEALVADYKEDPAETHEETDYDNYGGAIGSYTVTDKYPHLNISNIRSRTADGVETPVTKLPKPAKTAIGGNKPMPTRSSSPDVSFWNFQIPAFDPNQDGLNVPDVHATVAKLKSRSWLWPHMAKADSNVEAQATERIARIKAKVPVIIAALYEGKLISQEDPLVSLTVMGSYPWLQSPNDLDLIVVVGGDRAFERLEADKISEKVMGVIPGLPVNVEIVGLQTLQKALRGDDVPMAKVIRRKAMPYYSAVLLAGVDLWQNQRLPLANFVVMRNDLVNDIERANWMGIQNDPAKIAAKKRWRQTEVDALRAWLDNQWKMVLEGVRVSVEEALQREQGDLARDEETYQAEVAKLKREFSEGMRRKEREDSEAITALRAQQEKETKERIQALKQLLGERQREFQAARLVRQQGERKRVFDLVRSRVPAEMSQLIQALESLNPEVNPEVVAPDANLRGMVDTLAKQFHFNSHEINLLRIAVGMKAISDQRSEIRLTSAVARAASEMFEHVAVSDRREDIPANPVVVVLGNPVEEYPAYVARALDQLNPSKILVVGNGVKPAERYSIVKNPRGTKPEWLRISRALREKYPALVGGKLHIDRHDNSMNTAQNIEAVVSILARDGISPESVVLVQAPQGLLVSKRIFEKQWNDKVAKLKAEGKISASVSVPQPEILTWASSEYMAGIRKFIESGNSADVEPAVMHFQKDEADLMEGFLKDIRGQAARLLTWHEGGEGFIKYHPEDIPEEVLKNGNVLSAHLGLPAIEPKPIVTESRSEMRWGETVVTPRVSMEVESGSLGAKIGTAFRVAGKTVSPLLSSTPVYASEIAPNLFAGTEHYQSAPEIPDSFTVQWPILGRIVSGAAATASAERLVIDQRHGIPDKESVLPLVAFARYNPKTTVVLALVAAEDQVVEFQKAVAALQKGKAWPQNLKVWAFADENAFILEFNEFYNASAPLGRPVALVTDQDGSMVTGKIGFRRSLLSVVGDRDSLKQTASVLLAADKLLDESVWSLGYHFVSVDKLGGLEMLMTELTNFIRSEARMATSA